ncbi:MAG TPA: hypothetical protein PKI61_03755 [bacterium]|nr:hypothetical protein [bacterium]HPT29370.1 hypothetical protein [bacterium]
MRKLIFFLIAMVAVAATSIPSANAQIHEGSQVVFINTVPAELVPVVVITVNEDLDTLLASGEGIYENALIDDLELPSPSAANGYKPSRGEWVVPTAVEVLYVTFIYNEGKTVFSTTFDLNEDVTTIVLTPAVIGYMAPTKSEFKSDLLLVKNTSEYDMLVKTQEALNFPLDGVTLAPGGSTYTPRAAKSGVYHFDLYTLQKGVTVHTVKTVFISNTSNVVEFNGADVLPISAAGDGGEVTSVKFANESSYPVTITFMSSTSEANGKSKVAEDPVTIYLGPKSKTVKWFDVNLGSLPMTINLSYKGQEYRYDLQTIIFDRQKTVTISGSLKYGLKVINTTQGGSAYTY